MLQSSKFLSSGIAYSAYFEIRRLEFETECSEVICSAVEF